MTRSLFDSNLKRQGNLLVGESIISPVVDYGEDQFPSSSIVDVLTSHT